MLKKLDNPVPNGRENKHREQQGQREEKDHQRVVPMNGLSLVNRVVAEHETGSDEDADDEAEIDLSANLARLHRKRQNQKRQECVAEPAGCDASNRRVNGCLSGDDPGPESEERYGTEIKDLEGPRGVGEKFEQLVMYLPYC